MTRKLRILCITIGLMIFFSITGYHLAAKSDKCTNVTIHIFNANPNRKDITVIGVRYWDPTEEKFVDDNQTSEPFSIDYLDFQDKIRNLPHVKKKKTTIAVIFEFKTPEHLKQKGKKFISYSNEFKCKKNALIRVDIDGNNIKPEKDKD